MSDEDAVRLMSIHQSKGLEFPVVVAADLGKLFNLSDLKAEVLLDKVYGLCPQIKPPHTGKRYPSLPYWLACQRQRGELLGEELRLLYVAMTRARDTLILSGSVSETNLDRSWIAPREVSVPALLSARSYADWLGLWFAQDAGWRGSDAREGENAFVRWAIHDDTKLIGPWEEPAAEPAVMAPGAEPAVWQGLRQRLSWQYGFAAATTQPAKTSVSALRRRAAEAAEEEATPWFERRQKKSEVRGQKTEGASRITPRPSRQTAADVGQAHHKFLELVSLARVGSVAELKQEAERLRLEGALTVDETARLDFEGLAAFWTSGLGRKVQAQARFVQRELAFTARFSPEELAAVTGEAREPGLENEFVTVQGVADLAVVQAKEIWLIDFKTDRVAREALADQAKLYEPQLNLYARALARIYRRPVSQCWLYFLALRQPVAVDLPLLASSAAGKSH